MAVSSIKQTTADVIRTGDVVNNLTSTETDKPLSAAKGKVLNDQLTNYAKKLYSTPYWETTHTVALPHENGIYMIISSDGDVWTALGFTDGNGGRIGTHMTSTNIGSITISNFVMTITMTRASGVSVIRVV